MSLKGGEFDSKGGNARMTLQLLMFINGGSHLPSGDQSAEVTAPPPNSRPSIPQKIFLMRARK